MSEDLSEKKRENSMRRSFTLGESVWLNISEIHVIINRELFLEFRLLEFNDVMI